MSTETVETPEVVERDDFNNGNLLTFEVTWEGGFVERVKAHFISHPTPLGLRGDDSGGRHITFTGWYDGQHRTILSARPDRVRSIRLLDLLSPSPEPEPEVEDAGGEESAEGDAE